MTEPIPVVTPPPHLPAQRPAAADPAAGHVAVSGLGSAQLGHTAVRHCTARRNDDVTGRPSDVIVPARRVRPDGEFDRGGWQ